MVTADRGSAGGDALYVVLAPSPYTLLLLYCIWYHYNLLHTDRQSKRQNKGNGNNHVD